MTQDIPVYDRRTDPTSQVEIGRAELEFTAEGLMGRITLAEGHTAKAHLGDISIFVGPDSENKEEAHNACVSIIKKENTDG